MTKQDLQMLFNNAKREKAAFVGVRIETRGMEKPEYILNPYENIAQKLVYYNNAYNDDLTLKTYDGIRITAAAQGSDAYECMAWLMSGSGEGVTE